MARNFVKKSMEHFKGPGNSMLHIQLSLTLFIKSSVQDFLQGLWFLNLFISDQFQLLQGPGEAKEGPCKTELTTESN